MGEEASIIATLKGSKGTAQSEWLDLAVAQQELERITNELNDPNGPQFIRLGKNATVNRADVTSIELHEPPSFGIA
jgi:hypothetical protein